MVAAAEEMSKTPSAAIRAAPPLACHSREVLREAGIAGEEIDALLGAGVITQS